MNLLTHRYPYFNHYSRTRVSNSRPANAPSTARDPLANTERETLYKFTQYKGMVDDSFTHYFTLFDLQKSPIFTRPAHQNEFKTPVLDVIRNLRETGRKGDMKKGT